MRTALTAGDWDAVGAAIAEEWENRKRLAPGVTTPAIDALIARAAAAGATAAKVCGAGGGGCLFTYGPPERRAAIADALRAGGAALLDFTIEQHGLTRG
jgi:D-glycero-alpha-D-manno-heptose-7-phosphate kinase